MDYDKLIAPAAQAMRPSGIRKFFDLAAEMPVWPVCPFSGCCARRLS